jgi:hypothetical protein
MERGVERAGTDCRHAAIQVLIVRWVDEEPQPGIVECKLVDRFGRGWIFVEKCAVVSPVAIGADSTYPRSGLIGCRIISTGSDNSGRQIAVVDTGQPWGINAVTGEGRFEVFADQLTKLIKPAAGDDDADVC